VRVPDASINESGGVLKRGFALVCLLCALAGCVRIPIATMQATATDHNMVLQRASDEQLLLNLVRLRYHEPPFFMEPSAVSAQLRRNAEVSASAGISDAFVTERSASLGGRLGFSEQPTLTFVPLRGEAVMAKILSRLDLSTLLLLYHSGWDIERAAFRDTHFFSACFFEFTAQPLARASRRDRSNSNGIDGRPRLTPVRASYQATSPKLKV